MMFDPPLLTRPANKNNHFADVVKLPQGWALVTPLAQDTTLAVAIRCPQSKIHRFLFLAVH